MWLGYLEDYPDYSTQGESLKDLEDHLLDLYKDLSSGVIPFTRRMGRIASVVKSFDNSWLCALYQFLHPMY